MIGIEGVDRGTEGAEKRERFVGRSDEELRRVPHEGGVGDIDGGKGRALEPIITRVSNDTDNLPPVSAVWRDGRLRPAVVFESISANL